MILLSLRITQVIAALCIASPSLRHAPAHVAAAPGGLPSDLVSFLSGRWAGHGHFSAGKPVESEFTFTPALEGESLLVHHQEHAPADFEFSAIWSVDARTGEVVMLMASNHKGGARLFRSPGWRDGQITFQDDAALRAPFALERFTFSRTSSDGFATKYEYSIDDGATWRLGDAQTFSRQS